MTAGFGTAARRSYPLEQLRRGVLIAIAAVLDVLGLLLTGFFLLVLAGPDFGLVDLLVAALPMVLLGAPAGVLVWAALATRLELSPAGLRVVLPGAVVEAAWDSVSRLGVAAWGPVTGPALLLDRPAMVRRALWLFLMDEAQMARAIPVGAFATPLRGSRLEDDLRVAVPRAFQD